MSEPAVFAPLELELERLLAAVAPDRRTALAVRMGRALRRRQAERIAAQQNPDGSGFAPRKARQELRGKRGSIRRRAAAGAMFRKLRLARWLNSQATAEGAMVGFPGAAARIARVHQLGLRDRVSRDPNAPEATYPDRVLLGFTDEDIALMLDMVAAEIA